ncbi:MAG: FeoA family protein [Caldisericaceae bacterium]
MDKRITLINAPQGAKVRVISLDIERGLHTRHARRNPLIGSHFGADTGRAHQSYIRRLEEMGILPQDTLIVTRNGVIGPVEVAVKGSRLVIGRGIASRIIVEVIDE